MSDATFKPIRTALLSVYHKEGLLPVAQRLHDAGVQLISTGGTARLLREANLPVTDVFDLTQFPEILDGRVKTLHPGIFGGLLARRDNPTDLAQLSHHQLQPIDLVIVDLYPFEDTLKETTDEATLIEKIDIGGIALIRAAAKNHQDVAVVPSRLLYPDLLKRFETNGGVQTSRADRRYYAGEAFRVSSSYDTAIGGWLRGEAAQETTLRYGENPHQPARFVGDWSALFTQVQGKPLSYNNLLDVDAALRLRLDFDEEVTAVFKHTVPCGIASHEDSLQSWKCALACDPVSAFGGIVITGHTISKAFAEALNEHFYEVLLAPDFQEEALQVLAQKSKRIVLQYHAQNLPLEVERSALTGKLIQAADFAFTRPTDYEVQTNRQPNASELTDACFAERAAKHLKSNAIAIVRDRKLIGAGVGQPSRIDALHQALDKAKRFNHSVHGAVLASDGFFPFADSVETAHKAGIEVILEPGGSVRDDETIEYCRAHKLCLIFTGQRHFRH